MKKLLILLLLPLSLLGQSLDAKLRTKTGGMGLSTNDYSNTEKTTVSANKSAVGFILPSVSKNLIDKSQIVSGAWGSTTGARSYTSTTFRCTPLIPVKPSTTYTLSGVNVSFPGNEYGAGGVRNQVIAASGGSYSTVTFTTSASAVAVGINVNSNGLVGNDATAQLEEGSAATSYAAYVAPTTLQDKVGSMSPLYVSYSTSGYSGQPGFLVYCQYARGSSYYVGYTVVRYVNSGERADLYRITGADLYQYANGDMIPMNVNLITNGENECAWKGVGKTDYTGGVHGDESLTEVYFYINGIRQSSSDLSAIYKLRPANEFWYIQKSTMIETDNATPTTKALHQKRTDFSVGGYKTFNRLIWQATVSVDHWYSGIACIATTQADIAYDEDYTYYTLAHATTDGTRIVNKTGGKRQIDYYSTQFKLGAVVSSTILKPAADDTNANQEIWDSPAYAKYYRGLYTRTPVANDVWESVQTVKHYIQP